MRYRKLGNTGLEVSEIGFGAEWMEKPEEEVEQFVARCEDAGINIIDIWMSDPEIRRKLGNAMAKHGSRGRWIIQGHVGATWQDGQYVRTRDLEPSKEAFENLLELLQTDYVDLGIIHYLDDVDEFEQIMAGSPYLDYVHELHDSGTIRHIGLSTHNPDIALAALEYPEIEMIMFSVNPAFDIVPPTSDVESIKVDLDDPDAGCVDPRRIELYRRAKERGVGLTVMKTFGGGFLLDANKSPFGVALTPAQCIHYSLTRPAVASVLLGYSELSQIDDALAYESASEEERDYKDVLSQSLINAYRYEQCIFCGHCQPCSVGINIAAVNKFYELATMQPEVPESVREHYRALDKNASDCTGCRSCEPNCPFGVKIADGMERAAELFSGC